MNYRHYAGMASYLGNLTNHSSSSPRPTREPHSSDFCILPKPTSLDCRLTPTAGMPMLQLDASFGSDLSLDEAVHRLQDLMRENQELKSTVRDNNEMMKTVQRVLVEMKSNWDREKEDGMKKFDQAKSVVTALRKDVDAKKAKIEDMQRQNEQVPPPSLTNREMESLCREFEQCKNNLICLKKEQEVHNREMDNLKIKMEHSQKRNMETTEEIQKLTTALQAKSEEVESLENKMSQLVQHNKNMTEIKSTLTNEKENLVKVNKELQTQLQTYKESLVSSLSPESLTTMFKESVVVLDNKDDSKKQTERKYALTEVEEPDAEAERRSIAKLYSEQTSEKTLRESKLPLADIMSMLQSERSKVSELAAKVKDLTAALQSSSHELQIKDESLTHLRGSLDDQMKVLQTEHEERQGQLQREVDNMQRHLHESKSYQSQSQIDSIGNMKAQVVSLLNEVDESNRRLEIANDRTQRMQQRCDELERRCSQLHEEQENQRSKDDHLIEALRLAVSSTETSLATQKEKNEQKISMLQDKQIEIQDLKKECSTLKYQLEECKKKNVGQMTDGNVVMSLTRKRELEEKVDSLTAQLLSVEDTLLAKQEEIQKLQEKLILLRNETEDIPYLKAQIESYKSDFEAQRKACERLYREKVSLLEEADTLRLFNNQLKDQIGQLSTTHRHGSPSLHHASHPTPQHSISHPPQYPVSHGYYSSPSRDRDRMRSRPYPGGGYDECDINEGRQEGRGSNSPGRVPTEHSTVRGSSTFESAVTIADNAMRTQYECPKCGLKTQDIDSMTIHVDECLQDASPSI